MVVDKEGTWYFDLGKRQGMTDGERNRIRVGGDAKNNFRARYVPRLLGFPPGIGCDEKFLILTSLCVAETSPT